MCLISSDHSLYINCGGENVTVEGNVYEKDNDKSQFYLSPNGNWARSSAADIIYSAKCGRSNDALLYDKARTSPISLKYYGFCLRNGKYRVALHFPNIVEDDTFTTGNRVFDVYIQVIFFLVLSSRLTIQPFAVFVLLHCMLVI